MASEEAQLTPQDRTTCMMVGILMVVAKIEKNAQANVMTLDEEGAAMKSAKDFKMLIDAVWRMFPPGGLEEEVVKFARQCGFTIEQQYISESSQIPQ